MRIRNNIIALIVILTISMISTKAQESLPAACAGSIVRYGVGTGLPRSVYEWTVIGGTIINYYEDSIDVLWGNRRDTNAYIQVIEHSEFDCISDPFIAQIEITTPYIDIGDIINVCEGDTELVAVNGNYPYYRWSDEQTYSSSYEAHEPGIIWVEVMDKNSCVNRDSAEVKIRERPIVDLGEDQELCDNDRLVLDAGEDGIQYLWSTGHMASTITVVPGKQEYSVEVRNQYNCVTLDTINILACLSYKKLQESIPTAITPIPRDGHNDDFLIDHIKARYPDVEVEIFDRWGRRIYKSDVGYTVPWDGTFDGEELPMDSYYYVITVKDGMKPFVGSVSVVK